MHMKIDTKQKIKYIRAYLQQLKTSSSTGPFITINCPQCGFYDYEYITRRRFTITEVEKNLKQNKYQTVREVCQDIKQLYQNISDYILLNDPLQEQCARQVKIIGDFQNKFSEDFKQNRLIKIENKINKKQDTKTGVKDKEDINKDNLKQKEKQKEKPTQLLNNQFQRRSTFGQKLQMFFYLKSHEDNMQYIKSIGDGYHIGNQDQNGDYIIKLQISANACPWLQLLQKKDQ